MRHYVAKLDFEVGETGVPFIQGIEARDYDSAEKKIRRYMHTFYEAERPTETENKWEWQYTGVSIKLSEIVEVKDFDSLWRETMPIR